MYMTTYSMYIGKYTCLPTSRRYLGQFRSSNFGIIRRKISLSVFAVKENSFSTIYYVQ